MTKKEYWKRFTAQRQKATCADKRRYDTRQEAIRHRQQLVQKFGEEGCSIYRCAHCQGFHIGRRHGAMSPLYSLREGR